MVVVAYLRDRRRLIEMIVDLPIVLPPATGGGLIASIWTIRLAGSHFPTFRNPSPVYYHRGHFGSGGGLGTVLHTIGRGRLSTHRPQPIAGRPNLGCHPKRGGTAGSAPHRTTWPDRRCNPRMGPSFGRIWRYVALCRKSDEYDTDHAWPFIPWNRMSVWPLPCLWCSRLWRLDCYCSCDGCLEMRCTHEHGVRVAFSGQWGDLNLKVELDGQQRPVALIGPNGAGKHHSTNDGRSDTVLNGSLPIGVSQQSTPRRNR